MKWHDPKNYEFPDVERRERWAWEFLRGNEKYKSDYAIAEADESAIYDPPKDEGESDQHWMSRIVNEGGEPRAMRPSIALAIPWGLPKMHDPAVNDPPTFVEAYPYGPSWSDIQELYYCESDEAPMVQRPDIAVLAFSLNDPIAQQIKLAQDILRNRQASKPPQRKHRQEKLWPLYLRLLDATSSGATPGDIIKKIKHYEWMGKDAASGYQARDSVSDHLKAARDLRDYPLRILR